MCDLSLSYLFQIYTATPLVFTYIYKVVFWSNTLNGVAVKLNFLNVHPFEIWEHGGQTGQHDSERKALATNSNTANSSNRAFSHDNWQTGENNGRPRSRHWGWSPLPPGQWFGKAGVGRPQVVDQRLGKRRICLPSPLPCPVVSALYTQQEPVTTQLNHLKQKCLYTDSIFSSHYL